MTASAPMAVVIFLFMLLFFLFMTAFFLECGDLSRKPPHPGDSAEKQRERRKYENTGSEPKPSCESCAAISTSPICVTDVMRDRSLSLERIMYWDMYPGRRMFFRMMRFLRVHMRNFVVHRF